MDGQDPRQKVVASLIRQGATQAEVNAYLDAHPESAEPTHEHKPIRVLETENGVTREAESLPAIDGTMTAPRKKGWDESLLSTGAKLGDAGLGLSDEISGVANALGSQSFREGFGLDKAVKAYETARDRVRADKAIHSREHPVASAVEEFVGGVPTLGAAGKLLGGVSRLARGATVGGAAGFGNAEGSFDDQLGSTAVGAGLGAAGDKLLGAAGNGGAARALDAVKRRVANFAEQAGPMADAGIGMISPRLRYGLKFLKATGRAFRGKAPPPGVTAEVAAPAASGLPNDLQAAVDAKLLTLDQAEQQVAKRAAKAAQPAGPRELSPEDAAAIEARRQAEMARSNARAAAPKQNPNVIPKDPNIRGRTRHQRQVDEERLGLPKVTPDPPPFVSRPAVPEQDLSSALQGLPRAPTVDQLRTLLQNAGVSSPSTKDIQDAFSLWKQLR